MALTNVVRRAVSRVIPSTTRATGSQRHYHYHHKSYSTTFAPITCTGAVSQNLFGSSFLMTTRRPYSRRPTLRECDTSVVEVIDSEIRNKVKAEDIPERFPFDIEGETGLRILTLTRFFQCERITVVVDMPGEEGEDDSDEDDGDEDDSDDDSESENRSRIRMVVSVSKEPGPCLELRVYAHPDRIEIETLAIKDPKGGCDGNVYKLDENLRKAFDKYLDIRGINAQSINFLHGYMIRKDSKEYVQWLKKVKTFVEAF